MHLVGKSVVVTGAGGSIGSELCRRIANSGARRLTMVSLTESALYQISRKIQSSQTFEVEPVLGSVLDTDLMRTVVYGKDVVIHAAAHKHVPICEDNPCEAIQNNVGGTLSLALACAQGAVGQFVQISTDKAVNPVSVMGATKRVCERIVKDFAGGHTSFLTVRFGNVLDSCGSVMPLWREQIARGGPVTVTHPDCERYFMSIPEAVDLIVGTLGLRNGSGTFVLDMGQPRKILDLAYELIAAEALTSGNAIQVSFTGLRPGEKLTEELHHGGALLPTAHPKIFQVDGDPTPPLRLSDLPQLFDWAQRKDKLRARAKLFELAGNPIYPAVAA